MCAHVFVIYPCTSTYIYTQVRDAKDKADNSYGIAVAAIVLTLLLSLTAIIMSAYTLNRLKADEKAISCFGGPGSKYQRGDFDSHGTNLGGSGNNINGNMGGGYGSYAAPPPPPPQQQTYSPPPRMPPAPAPAASPRPVAPPPPPPQAQSPSTKAVELSLI